MMSIIAGFIQSFASGVLGGGKWIYDVSGTYLPGVKLGITLFIILLYLCDALRKRRFFSPVAWLIWAIGCAYIGQIYLRENCLRVGSCLYLASAVFGFCYCALVRGEYGLSEVIVGKKTTVILVICVLLCAIFARFYRFADFPYTINNDEALASKYALNTMRGEELRGWWAGQSQFFNAALYGEGIFFKIFGASVGTARATSAVVGVLGIIAFFLMVDILFKRAVALIAAFSLAVCFFSFGFDRIALPVNWGTVFACLGIYLLLLAEKKGQFLGLFSGLVLGEGLRTYDVYKAALVVVTIFIIYRLVSERGYLQKNWLALLLVIGGFLAVTWNLLAEHAHYATGRSAEFLREQGQSSLFSLPYMGFMLKNFKALVIMMFSEMRYSIFLLRPGPILNDFLVPLFCLGFVCAIYSWKKYNYFLVLAWVIIGPIGGIISLMDIRRVIIFLPAIHLCVALGAFLLLRTILHSLGLRGSVAFIVLFAVMASAIFMVNTYIYFNKAWGWTGAGSRELGEYVKSQTGKRFIYLLGLGDEPTVYFFTYDKRKGENPRNYYEYVDVKDIRKDEIYQYIFSPPPQDIVFVCGQSRENNMLWDSIEKEMPCAKVERKQHILACSIDEQDLERDRGAWATYYSASPEDEQRGAVYAYRDTYMVKALTTEFDPEQYPPPVGYPFQMEMESYFYVPRDGQYRFEIRGGRDTEVSVDGVQLTTAFSQGCFLKSGAHKIKIVHLQEDAGKFSVMMRMGGKIEPLYLWGDILPRLFGQPG